MEACLYNRCRFLREILANVRGRVGDDFPMQLRLSAVEGVPGGLSMGETLAIAQLAEEAGIDSIHISQGNHVAMARMISPSAVPRAAHAENAAAVKQVVHIPVIGVGRINEPMIAAAMLDAGKMDLVAWGAHPWPIPNCPIRRVRDVSKTSDIALDVCRAVSAGQGMEAFAVWPIRDWALNTETSIGQLRSAKRC